MKLWKKVLIGMISGVLVGHLLSSYPSLLEIANIGGQMFMRLIRMLMGPMIFCVICAGILSVSNIKSFGHTGAKIVLLSLFNTCFAIIFGIVAASIVVPGNNFNMDLLNDFLPRSTSTFSIKVFMCNFIPDNIFASFSQGNLIQIVFFAIFTGITCQLYDKHYKSVKNGVVAISDILFYMMEKIMYLSPYGAFFLIAYAVGTQGVIVLSALGKLVFTQCITMFLQYLVFGLSIILFCKRSPMPFYRKSILYQILAFSISSSKLVLPKTMKICKESLGISEFGSKVALPIASAFNITGSGIQLGISAIFFAQVYQIDLSFMNYFYIVLLSTVGAMGCAGVPGLSIVILPMVLDSIGVPVESVGILLGIDRILDMLRTTLNITGDVATAMIVDHSEGRMDYSTYYQK